MNLKRETELMLKEYGKGVDDIVWIGQKDEYRVSNRHMLNYLDVEYNNDYTGYQIPENLVVVGEDWWLERIAEVSYEKWVFKTTPQPPKRIVRDGKLL